MGEMIEISKDEYKQLIKDQQFLEALKGAGVDNWEGYDYALELLDDEE